jgi:hypothetical protein
MPWLPSPPMPISASTRSRRRPSMTSSENGPALAHQRAVEDIETHFARPRRPFHQPLGALFDTHDLPAIAFDRPVDHGAQHRIQAGAIAATGQNPQSHMSLPLSAGGPK